MTMFALQSTYDEHPPHSPPLRLPVCLTNFNTSAHNLMRNAKRKRTRDASPSMVKTRAKVNRYAGYTVAPGAVIDRVRAAECTADTLDLKYVSKRRPVIIADVFAGDSDLKACAQWTNGFLRRRCGGDDATTRVETRDVEAREAFGRGKYRAMTFDAFMDKFERGDGGWYLSAGGKRSMFGAPASKLVREESDGSDGLLPLRPRIIPRSLVPADINLWMGRNDRPTSSGLHHDYHDNLYVLARGSKRFKVFSPLDTERMYTSGKIRVVHENGLIDYEGAQITGHGGDVGACTGGGNAEGNDDDDDDSDEEEEFSFDDDDDFADFDGVDDYDEMNESDDADSESGREEAASGLDEDKEDPPSFSRVDYNDLDRFPLFKGAKSMEFTVNAGEALFLPAGWFHDVSSDDMGAGHVAFNYWFHPRPISN